MINESLAQDYIDRSRKRIKALETLFQEEAWADVIRESQEVVELLLNSLLRQSRIDSPRIHDVSEILKRESASVLPGIRPFIGELAKISRDLRRDRELAFYGAEDLTPSEFYSKEDAVLALSQAKRVYLIVSQSGKDVKP